MAEKKAYDRLIDVINHNSANMHNTTKEERDNAFWKAAVDAFNEDVAGDVTTIDGTILTIKTIEL